MTTESAVPRRRRPGDVAVPAVTAVAAATAAASVAWAAATPVHKTAPAPQPPAVDTSDAQQQLVGLQRSIAQVRSDLVRMRSMRLPRASAPTTSGTLSAPYAGPAANSGSAHVGWAPAVPVPAAVAPPPPPAAAPQAPPAHTSTGASGAGH